MEWHHPQLQNQKLKRDIWGSNDTLVLIPWLSEYIQHLMASDIWLSGHGSLILDSASEGHQGGHVNGLRLSPQAQAALHELLEQVDTERWRLCLLVYTPSPPCRSSIKHWSEDCTMSPKSIVNPRHRSARVNTTTCFKASRSSSPRPGCPRFPKHKKS